MTARDSPSLAIPRGWFRVGFEDESPPGSLRAVRYFGADLVLAVSESGAPQLFDAHCPHLGAHIGIGGTVEGESVRCPFHGWRFDRTGQCVEVPYARRIPPAAQLRAWPTVARNGILFAWHDAPGAEPAWEVPEVPEVGHADWSPLQHHRWRIRTRCQEIAENTADPAHFDAVHGFPGGGAELRFEGPRFHATNSFEAPGAKGERLASRLEVSWHGLGLGITRSTGALDLLFLGTTTPIDANEVETCFSFSVCRARGLEPDVGFGRACIAEAVRQLEQDIPIWENKRFLPKPLLCDGDGPIGRFRAWSAQFHE
jgi:phenylpropionate dioxygenase-like ring-hydroxylating dioxygenase large terminal subunit